MAVVPSPISEIPCEARITWYVNDVVVSEVDMGLNEMTPLIWEFKEPGTYIVKLRVCNCCGCCTYEQEVTIGPFLYIERLDCSKFVLKDNYEYEGLTLEINLFDTDNNKTNLISQVSYTGKSDFVISLPSDGVYVIEYIIRDLTGLIIRTERFVVYEFCSILKCYKELLMQINCKNCDPCHDYNKGDMTLLMNQLNQFIMNLFAFGINISVHYGLESHFFYFDDKYTSFIKDTNTILQQLMRMCGRCGFIKNKTTNPIKCTMIKKPCITC
jgi:hypothetical protein